MARARELRIGAFFDVDKTILAENSGAVYLRALYERGEIEWTTLVANLASYLRYKLNLLDLERWTAATVEQLRGRPEQELFDEGEKLFEPYIRPTIYPQAEQRVREHLQRGHVVALVSGATRFVVEPLAAHLGVKHLLHTQLEVREGILTGRVIPPVCFGEGKIYWLQQLIEQEDVDLARSYFYTDSITDRPLLDLVGHPMVVNPDPLLYRHARRRRWPVQYYREPEPLRRARSEAEAADA